MDRYNFRFSAGSEFTEKFHRLAEVLGVECPHLHLEEIFGQAIEMALDKKDPKRKLERRRKREAKREGSAAEEYFGREFIRRKIDARRRETATRAGIR